MQNNEQPMAQCCNNNTAPAETTEKQKTLPQSKKSKNINYNKHRPSAWWQVLVAAMLVTGVWFGARSFYMHKMSHRADQKITDTYIAMRDSIEGTDSIEVVMQQAMLSMRNNMTDEAIGLLEPLYQQSGMNKEVGIALSMAYIKAKEREKAIDTLNEMNQHYDGDPEIEELLKIIMN
jgi:predicted Zn-dependent protease